MTGIMNPAVSQRREGGQRVKSTKK